MGWGASVMGVHKEETVRIGMVYPRRWNAVVEQDVYNVLQGYVGCMHRGDMCAVDDKIGPHLG